MLQVAPALGGARRAPFWRIAATLAARSTGVPHVPGTREYLACEVGQVVLVASGESFTLDTGDVVVCRGAERHSYLDRGTRPAVGYSVLVLAPRPA